MKVANDTLANAIWSYTVQQKISLITTLRRMLTVSLVMVMLVMVDAVKRVNYSNSTIPSHTNAAIMATLLSPILAKTLVSDALKCKYSNINYTVTLYNLPN